MCGICGMVGKADKFTVEKMVEKMEHRGPDGQGYYFDKSLAFGHVRLSILDLSENGAQPMVSQSGRYVITYNGEVYNFLELRDELVSLGYNFISNSDTEVLLNAYIEWEEKCLDRLNGMFAFAIWDKEKRQLFCVRDRLGVKPFYYYMDSNSFVFASEIKSILEYKEYMPMPNDKIIYDYLIDGYVEHTEDTFFSGIKKLSPGSYIKIDDNLNIEFYRYWDLSINNMLHNNGDKVTQIEQMKELLLDSVKLRLRSDVSVGSCLSGGLDSSSIVCIINNMLMKENAEAKQETFSSCFEDERFDERKYIDEVIKVTNTKKNLIFPNSDNLIEDINKLIYHQEEPFLGTSIFAQWSIMKEVNKKGVRVLLDGQGADEILAGYRKYRIYLIKELLRNKKYFSCIKELIGGMRQNHASYNFSSDINKIKRLLGLSYGTTIMDYINFKDHKESGGKRHKLPKDFAEALYLDLTKYSIPALLRYEDKNSMAFSVEARVPFLDYRLVEFLASLPTQFKINNGWSKWILREAMKGTLPEKIRTRKDKMGFVTSEKLWLQEQKEFITKIFSNAGFKAHRYVDRIKILSNLDSLINSDRYTYLWRFINLELWMQQFFK